MLLNECLIPLALSVAIPICAATKVLPQGRLPVVEFPGAAEICEVEVNINDSTDAVLRPHLRLPAIPVQKHLISSDRKPEKVRRTLLGSRQNCNPGYSLCSGKSSLPLLQTFGMTSTDFFFRLRRMLP